MKSLAAAVLAAGLQAAYLLQVDRSLPETRFGPLYPSSVLQAASCLGVFLYAAFLVRVASAEGPLRGVLRPFAGSALLSGLLAFAFFEASYLLGRVSMLGGSVCAAPWTVLLPQCLLICPFLFVFCFLTTAGRVDPPVLPARAR